MTDAEIDLTCLPAEIELIPANYFAPLDLARIFSRPAPLEVDLGCGDGTFLAALAERLPERNFLGIEKLAGRVEASCRKGKVRALRNLRILRIETSYAIQYLLPSGSVSVVHLLFPDPWPKKRHYRRRIVTSEFLTVVHRLLSDGGQLRIATDQEDYYAAIRGLLLPRQFREETNPPEGTFPPTKFEKRFLAQGATIYRLELRKAK